MAGRADVLIFGTGDFAARILFDLAAAGRGLSIAVAGRNADRLAWLRTGANARADLFATGARAADYRLETVSTAQAADLLQKLRPRIVFNAASAQGGRRAPANPDGWTRLTQEAGLGVAAALNAKISLDVARAVAAAAPDAYFVNGCYPDVVNPMIAAAGLPVACGVGNVAILAHAFAGQLGPGHGRLRMLAQHAALAAFRRPAAERTGPAPLRLWLEGREIADIFPRFDAVKLAPEPVIDVSGASAVPLFLAMARKESWRGHAPGPQGRPGGYPVKLESGVLSLDLPAGLAEEEAVEWNAAFERRNGVTVERDGRVRYAGKVEETLRNVSPELAAGFAMADFDAAYSAMAELRRRLRDAPGDV